MNIPDELKPSYERLFEKYKKANLVSYGSPDQYQFRKNELVMEITEILLYPYLKKQEEENG